MNELRASTRFYLAALAMAATVVLVVALLQTPAPSLRDGVLAVVFCGLQVAAVCYPLDLASQQKYSLHTSVIFAAVLLFEPGTALLIAGIGTLIAELIRRQPLDQTVFNVSQTALQAGVAGLLLAAIDPDGNTLAFERLESFLGVIVVAIVIYVIDVAAIGIVIRLQEGQRLLDVPKGPPVGSLLDDLSLFAFGLLIAVAVDAQVWTLPVLLLLAFQIHRASRRSLAAQEHERRLLAESQRTAHARQEFLLTASHELKTPITTIKMAAQLLDRALIQRQPAFQIDEAGIIRWRDQLMLGIARLEKLVAELLDAVRIQQGRLEIHPEHVDLVELAATVVERFEHAAERTPRHRLVLDATGSVDGDWDPSGLDQVLTNLVSNALKYSPDGGDIVVAVREEDEHASLMVTDSGIGISPEQQAEVFTPFARGVPATSGISGTGLGLYITRRVVEQHGGTITLDSTPGIGTTITVVLPRSQAANESDQVTANLPTTISR